MTESTRESEALEELRLLNLETQIVRIIGERLGVGPEDAMRVYFESELAAPIERNQYGLQFLDAAYLAEDVLKRASKPGARSAQ